MRWVCYILQVPVRYWRYYPMKVIQNNPATLFLLNLIISHQSELLRYSFLINPTLNEVNCASTCPDFVYGQGTILSIVIAISHSYFHIPVCSHSIPIIHHFLLVKCHENQNSIMTGRTPQPLSHSAGEVPKDQGKEGVTLASGWSQRKWGKKLTWHCLQKWFWMLHTPKWDIYITDIVGTVGSCYICYIVYD
jgi:hypothetical protein